MTFSGTAVDVAMFTGSTIDKPGVGYALVPSSSASTITWSAGVSLSVAVSPTVGVQLVRHGRLVNRA